MVAEHVTEENADMMLLTERWLQPTNYAVIRGVTSAGYHYQALGSPGHRRCGGLGALHKEHLDFTLHADAEEFTSFGPMQLDLKTPAYSLPVRIVVVYRPPETPLEASKGVSFMDEFEAL